MTEGPFPEEPTVQLERIGRYRLLRPLGEGAMARVYLAELDALGGFRRKVAIKVVRPDYARDEKFVKLLAREAMIGSRLQHPNIVQTLEFNQDAGRHFLALEFVEGETLADLLTKAYKEKGTGLPHVLVIESMIQVLKGLAYSHALTDQDGTPFGIIHRDLKPGNIMLSRHGQVKVMDFGIAKAKVAAANLTTVGQVRGTPIYMAPEQVTGKDLDGRTDQFAAATVLFELLTGEQVFISSNLVVIMQRVARADVGDALERADKEIPGLGPILGRMWSKRPADRYPDCDEAATELETLLLSGATSSERIQGAPAESTGKRLRARKKKKKEKEKEKEKAREGRVLNFVTGLLSRKPPPPPPKKKRKRKRRRPEEATQAEAPAAPEIPSPSESVPPEKPGEQVPDPEGTPSVSAAVVFEDSTFSGTSSMKLSPASGLLLDGPAEGQWNQDGVVTNPSLDSIASIDPRLSSPEHLASTDLPSSPSLAAVVAPKEPAEPEVELPEGDGSELPTTAVLAPREELLSIPPTDAKRPLEESVPLLEEPPAVRKSLFDPPTSEHFSVVEDSTHELDEKTRPASSPPADPFPEEPEQGTVTWENRPPGRRDGVEKDEAEGLDDEESAPMDDFFFGDFDA
jgi:serine/threonine protein kinase